MSTGLGGSSESSGSDSAGFPANLAQQLFEAVAPVLDIIDEQGILYDGLPSTATSGWGAAGSALLGGSARGASAEQQASSLARNGGSDGRQTLQNLMEAQDRVLSCLRSEDAAVTAQAAEALLSCNGVPAASLRLASAFFRWRPAAQDAETVERHQGEQQWQPQQHVEPWVNVFINAINILAKLLDGTRVRGPGRMGSARDASGGQSGKGGTSSNSSSSSGSGDTALLRPAAVLKSLDLGCRLLRMRVLHSCSRQLAALHQALHGAQEQLPLPRSATGAASAAQERSSSRGSAAAVGSGPGTLSPAASSWVLHGALMLMVPMVGLACTAVLTLRQDTSPADVGRKGPGKQRAKEEGQGARKGERRCGGHAHEDEAEEQVRQQEKHQEQQQQLRWLSRRFLLQLAEAVRDSGVLDHWARAGLLRALHPQPPADSSTPETDRAASITEHVRFYIAHWIDIVTFAGAHDAGYGNGAQPTIATSYMPLAARAAFRHVITGHSSQHLVLSLGMRALCTADGGPQYGMPLSCATALQVGVGPDSQYPHVRVVQNRFVECLAKLLAFGGEAECEGQPGAASPLLPALRPPRRRLSLLLRMARLAVLSAEAFSATAALATTAAASSASPAASAASSCVPSCSGASFSASASCASAAAATACAAAASSPTTAVTSTIPAASTVAHTSSAASSASAAAAFFPSIDPTASASGPPCSSPGSLPCYLPSSELFPVAVLSLAAARTLLWPRKEQQDQQQGQQQWRKRSKDTQHDEDDQTAQQTHSVQRRHRKGLPNAAATGARAAQVQSAMAEWWRALTGTAQYALPYNNTEAQRLALARWMSLAELGEPNLEGGP